MVFEGFGEVSGLSRRTPRGWQHRDNTGGKTVNDDTSNAMPVAPRKRQSGARNADAKYVAWLHRHKILVIEAPEHEGFIEAWIQDGINLFKDEGGAPGLATHLNINPRTLKDAKAGRTTPTLSWFMMLAELLGREQELEECMALPGVEDWSPIGRYCGENNEDLKGCGTHFHSHHEDGLCEDCHNGKDDPDFIARDVREANAKGYKA